jgi:hypothetical protein
MSLIATQNIPVTGLSPTFAACAAGDLARVGEGLTLEVINSDSADHTVTLAVPGVGPNGVAIPDTVVTITHGVTTPTRIPLETFYADPTANRCARLTYSSTTGMTRAVTKR